MKQSKGASELIDLSFLSAEEEAAIRQVLLRDEDLKRLETGRIRKLKQSFPDPKQLKTLTGEWFEELRAKRYGQQTDVSTVVRSSMRWKKTAAHKPNPFLNDILEENKDEKEELSTPPNPSTDPRLIHPALSEETYRQYTDEDFMEDETSPCPSLTSKGSSEKLKLRTINDVSPVIKDTDSSSNLTETQKHTELSVKPSAVQVQPWSKSEKDATENATNSEPRRKVSLPPALRKDQSFEENWVKISLEPNTVKPAQVESSVENKQREVNAQAENTETLKKQGISRQKKVDHFGGDVMKSPSLDFIDQTTFQIVTKKSSQADPLHFKQDVSSERSSSPEFENQSQASLCEVSDAQEFTRPSDHEGSKELVKAVSAFQDSTSRNHNRSFTFLFSESETGKTNYSPSNSTIKQDKGRVVPRDTLNDEASLDTKGKNSHSGMLSGADMDQALDHVSDEERINKHSTVEVASQSQSVKSRHEMESFVFPSDTLQGKDDSNDFGDDGSVEMGKEKKSNDHSVRDKPLLLNERMADVSVVEDFKMSSPHRLPKPHVSDKTVLRDLDAHEDKDKIKIQSSNVLDAPNDTYSASQVLAEQSKDHLSMTHDVRLTYNEDVGLDDDKSAVEPSQPAKSDQPTRRDFAKMLTVTKQGQGSSEIKDEEGNGEAEQRTESNILLSVLARAQKSKPRITVQDPKQDTGHDAIPTIVIMPSESPEPKEKEGNKPEATVLAASVEGSTPLPPSYTADAWEDEGVDSDDDNTSLSSYGSDLSSRKDHSASALSLTDRTSSLLSVYSAAGDYGNVEVQGSVEFAMMYSPVGELVIMVEQCQDLAIANPRKQRTDPYVKTYLYPDKRSKRKTSIKKRTVNPVYVESLRYKVKREELPTKTLNLSVWHNDSRGRNVFLGQVEINLKIWDWGHEALTWYNLQPKTSENQESQEHHGTLSVSLKYVPPVSTGRSKKSTGEIHVWLQEAKELRSLKPQAVDSFVKCYILPDTRKKSRQKTRVVKKTQSPVYNHTMVYDGFGIEEVNEACCELTVWDHNTLSNQFLGGVRLSLGSGQSYGKKVDWMDSVNEEVQIWKRMLANPNSWVEGELPLRSSMTPRK